MQAHGGKEKAILLSQLWPDLVDDTHIAFSSCSWGSQGKNTEGVCHSLLQWTTFCQTSPPWPVRLGWPHMAWLSFIELNKAVVLVIRSASFLWLWFQSVCRLMPSLRAFCPLFILVFSSSQIHQRLSYISFQKNIDTLQILWLFIFIFFNLGVA